MNSFPKKMKCGKVPMIIELTGLPMFSIVTKQLAWMNKGMALKNFLRYH